MDDESTPVSSGPDMSNPKTKKTLLIVGGLGLAVLAYLYMKKKSSSSTTTASAGTPEIIYPQTLSGNSTGTGSTGYNQLQTGISNSQSATSQQLAALQQQLDQQIAGMQSANTGSITYTTPPTPVSSPVTSTPVSTNLSPSPTYTQAQANTPSFTGVAPFNPSNQYQALSSPLAAEQAYASGQPLYWLTSTGPVLTSPGMAKPTNAIGQTIYTAG